RNTYPTRMTVPPWLSTPPPRGFGRPRDAGRPWRLLHRGPLVQGLDVDRGGRAAPARAVPGAQRICRPARDVPRRAVLHRPHPAPRRRRAVPLLREAARARPPLRRAPVLFRVRAPSVT